MRRTRVVHRILGLILLLPMLGWVATGLVFFVKPGYEAAYEPLGVRRLVLDGAVTTAPARDWLEIRRLRTILGDHLLARTGDGPVHVDPATLDPQPLPDEASIRRLVEDAIAGKDARYGTIVSVTRRDGPTPTATIVTSTGVEIELDWSQLQLQQSGPDTRRIDALYRIHYLQWTGTPVIDRVLGGAGLIALLSLTGLGLRLAAASSPRPPQGSERRDAPSGR